MNKGIIPCIADGGMRGLAEELNPNGVNETCNWHSFQRLGLRAGNAGSEIILARD